MRLRLKGIQIIHDAGTEEGDSIRQSGFIHNHFRAFGLDAFHNALDGALAEVVGAGFHGQAVNAHDDFLFLRGVEGAGGGVVAGLFQDAVGDVVLAGAVAVDDSLDEVLRDVVEVREELLRVLREAVAAIAETRVVVVRADTRIQANAVDNRLCVKSLHLRVGIQFVEITHAERKIRVREQFHRLGLGRSHEQHGDVLLQGAFGDDAGEGMRGKGQAIIIKTHNDP